MTGIESIVVGILFFSWAGSETYIFNSINYVNYIDQLHSGEQNLNFNIEFLHEIASGTGYGPTLILL